MHVEIVIVITVILNKIIEKIWNFRTSALQKEQISGAIFIKYIL